MAGPLAGTEFVDVLLELRSRCKDRAAIRLIDEHLAAFSHRVTIGEHEAAEELDRVDRGLCRLAAPRRSWWRPKAPGPGAPIDA
jgi:hypothetical protein